MTEQEIPRRWAKGASPDFVQARSELVKEEYKLRNDIERVAEMRRNLPPGPVVEPYVLEEASVGAPLDGSTVTLHELVKDRPLVVYHLMLSDADEEACPACSMVVDGINGVATHLRQHADLVVVGKASPAKLQVWATRRGWSNVRLLSSHKSTFNADLNVENPDWNPKLNQVPATSVFRRDGDVVRQVYCCTPGFLKGELRGMDLLTPVWNFLDILPGGRGDWNPSNDYIKEVHAV